MTMCGDGSSPGRAWLDQVHFLKDASPRLALGIPDDSVVVGQLFGLPGTRVSLQVSADFREWASVDVPVVIPENGIVPWVLGLRRVPTFYRAVEVP